MAGLNRSSHCRLANKYLINLNRYDVKKYLNLACGADYVTDEQWVNLDFSPHNTNHVLSVDLLSRLPFDDASVDVVYSSHFFEHIPRQQVADFLSECMRILKPSGHLRLVLPDLENLCREYLKRREIGDHDKAYFVVLEMIDQCVRACSGGDLNRFYQQVKTAPDANKEMISYVRERTGEDLLYHQLNNSPPRTVGKTALWIRARSSLKEFRHRLGLRLLDAAFKRQNVSLATLGERHHWLWDYWQLANVLETAGFIDIVRLDCRSTRIEAFPLVPLDSDANGLPRKGAESMFLEARKPS